MMFRFQSIIPGLLLVIALFAAFKQLVLNDGTSGAVADRQDEEQMKVTPGPSEASMSEGVLRRQHSPQASVAAELLADDAQTDAEEMPRQRPRIDVVYQNLLSEIMAVPVMYDLEHQGCRSTQYYLIEMELEDRKPDWAIDAEKELRKLWSTAEHAQVELIAQCHATICRIVAHPDDGIDPDALNSLQGHILRAYFRSELTRAFDLVGSHHNRHLGVWAFRSKRREWADEARCGSIAESPPEIAGQRELEGKEIAQSCSGSSDYLLCLSQNGFHCKLIVNYGDTPYLCKKDAPPGHFEALWSPEDDGYSGKIHWINDHDGHEASSVQ